MTSRLVPWLLALALTVLIETAIALALGRRHRRRLLLDAPLLNLLTQPLATAAYLHLDVSLLPLEIAVLLVEAVGYRIVTGLTWSRAFGTSFLCNAATAPLSLVL